MKSLTQFFGMEKIQLLDQPLPAAEFYLRQWGVPYKENKDGRLEVRELRIRGLGLTELPDLSRVDVKVMFDCSNNALTSLKGAPGTACYFVCAHNKLTSLEGAPEKTLGSFDCSNNELETLDGSPRTVGDFTCSGNKLLSLKGGPETARGIYCGNNPMDTFDGAPKSFSYISSDFGTFYSRYEWVEKASPNPVPDKLLRPVEETLPWLRRQEERKPPSPGKKGKLNL